MRIKMSDGNDTIEWSTEIMLNGSYRVYQNDNKGEFFQRFPDYHQACLWLIDQVEYVRKNMDYKFTDL